MSPDSCPGLADKWGAEFDALYTQYECEGRAMQKVKAQRLWFAILEAQVETGNPFMLFKDHCNRKSNQQVGQAAVWDCPPLSRSGHSSHCAPQQHPRQSHSHLSLAIRKLPGFIVACSDLCAPTRRPLARPPEPGNHQVLQPLHRNCAIHVPGGDRSLQLGVSRTTALCPPKDAGRARECILQ